MNYYWIIIISINFLGLIALFLYHGDRINNIYDTETKVFKKLKDFIKEDELIWEQFKKHVETEANDIHEQCSDIAKRTILDFYTNNNTMNVKIAGVDYKLETAILENKKKIASLMLKEFCNSNNGKLIDELVKSINRKQLNK